MDDIYRVGWTIEEVGVEQYIGMEAVYIGMVRVLIGMSVTRCVESSCPLNEGMAYGTCCAGH